MITPRWFRFAGLLALAGLAGCAPTGYVPDGPFGGYSDEWLEENVVRVDFDGNGFTDVARTRDFSVLRAAELCLLHGVDGIVVLGVDAADRTSHTIGIGGAPSSSTTRPVSAVVARCVTLPTDNALSVLQIQAEVRDHYELGPPGEIRASARAW